MLCAILIFGQPEIKFDTTIYDFGQIEEGAYRLEGEFYFTNRGTEPLIISRAHSTGDCVVVRDYPREPILSGESGVITFSWNTNTIIGTINKPKFRIRKSNYA